MFDKSIFRLTESKILNAINSSDIKSLHETTKEKIEANRQRRAERVAQNKERKKERDALKAKATADTQALINRGIDPDEAKAKALDALKADEKFMERALNAGMRVGKSQYAGSLTYQVGSAAERLDRKKRAEAAKEHLFDAKGKAKLYDTSSGQMVSASQTAEYARIKAENERRTQERIQAAQPSRPARGRTDDYINPNSPEARVIADIKAGKLDPVVLRTSEPAHQRAIKAVEAAGIKVPKEMQRRQDDARVAAAVSRTHAEINQRKAEEIRQREKRIAELDTRSKAFRATDRTISKLFRDKLRPWQK